MLRAATGVLALLTLAGCASANGDAGSPRLQVVTTVAPITSIVAAVAGDRADVVGLVPEGTNSHTFEPPPSAAEALTRADAVFLNGLWLEEPVAQLAERNVGADTEVVRLGDAVLPEKDYIYDFSFPRSGGKPNPHLWTDPTYAIRYAAVVRDLLTELDPGGRTTFATGYANFARRATALSDALRTSQTTMPAGARRLLTYHDAYAYFARTYGWEVIGAIQPESFDDPTPRDVAALIEDIRRLKVPTIFGSEVFPSRILERISAETGARYEATLRDDDLPGKPGDAEHSWLGLMRYNFATMVEALGGDASAIRAVDLPPAGADNADYPQ